MSKKPYRYDGQFEYLEMISMPDWNDDKFNPDDLAQYSEMQRPYLFEKEPWNYASWEWAWPPMDWPPIPPPTIVDPVPNPCSIDEDCVWAGIIGPDTLECGKCYPYTQAHLYIGCDIAPWFAAFGRWELSGSNDGQCYLLFGDETSLIATVCCSEPASGTLTLCYYGALSCTGCIDIVIECVECCDEFTVTGNTTVNAGNLWTGTITPACPGASCSVVSNSGCVLACEVDGTGSTVTVQTGGSDCGGFTVTVQDEGVGEDCAENSSSIHVRIIGGNGDWRYQSSPSCYCNSGGTCNCGYGSGNPYAPCVVANQYKYGINLGMNFDCSANWGYTCHAGTSCGANEAGVCGDAYNCGDPLAACGNPPDWCTCHNYHICEWKCADADNCT